VAAAITLFASSPLVETGRYRPFHPEAQVKGFGSSGGGLSGGGGGSWLRR